MEMRVFIGGYFTYADRVDDVDVGVDGTGGRLQRQQVVEHVRHLRHLAEVDEVIVQLVRKCRVREDKVAKMHTSETCKDMCWLRDRSNYSTCLLLAIQLHVHVCSVQLYFWQLQTNLAGSKE